MTQVQNPLFKSEYPKIKFVDIAFKPGLQYTVRDGAEWSKEHGVKVGNQVVLCDIDGAEVAVAIVTHKIICSLGDIPKEVIAKSHGAMIRNAIHFMDYLQAAYGRLFKSADFVTCIGFEVIG